MPRGGLRNPPGGRPRGSRDTYPRREKLKLHGEIQQHLADQGIEPFPGDGVDLMISVYKDPRQPWERRVQCATAAAPYERPRLNAVAMVTPPSAGDTKLDVGAALVDAILRLQGEESAPPRAPEAIIPVVRPRADEVVPATPDVSSDTQDTEDDEGMIEVATPTRGGQWLISRVPRTRSN